VESIKQLKSKSCENQELTGLTFSLPMETDPVANENAPIGRENVPTRAIGHKIHNNR